MNDCKKSRLQKPLITRSSHASVRHSSNSFLFRTARENLHTENKFNKKVNHNKIDSN